MWRLGCGFLVIRIHIPWPTAEVTDLCVPVHLTEANTSGVRPGPMAVTSLAHKLKGGDTEVSAACCGADAVSHKTDKSQFF